MKPIVNLLIKELNQIRKIKATKTTYDKVCSGWAYLNANIAYTAPAWQTIPFNTKVVDQTGSFANWTPEYSINAPVDGVYLIKATVCLTGGTTGTYNGYTGLFVNRGSGYLEEAISDPKTITHDTSKGNSSLNGEWIVTLKKGELAQVRMAFGANVNMANSKGTRISWCILNEAS